MASAIDLCDLDKARQNLPASSNADEPAISTLITAASRAIRQYCSRDFVSTAYDELYNGTGQRRLVLREYPIISVQSLRYRPVTVLKIINSLANTPIARVAVTATGLTLVRVTSGVVTTVSVTFAANITVGALITAINAIGSGWSAVTASYDTWPSADIRFPQGSLTAAGQFAEIKMHTYELAGYQIDERRGWLLRAIPYTDPELLHPEDLIFPVGINNFRVQYTAGYATIPEDIQEACAELVMTWFLQRGRDLTISSETVMGARQYAIQPTRGLIPERIRSIIRPYKKHRVANNQG